MMKRPFSSIQLQIRGNLPEDMQAFLTSFRNSVGVRAFLQICESSVQKKTKQNLKKNPPSLYYWSPPAHESPVPPKKEITYTLSLWNDSAFSGLKLNLFWIISYSFGSAFQPSSFNNSFIAAFNSRLSCSVSVFSTFLDPLFCPFTFHFQPCKHPCFYIPLSSFWGLCAFAGSNSLIQENVEPDCILRAIIVMYAIVRLYHSDEEIMFFFSFWENYILDLKYMGGTRSSFPDKWERGTNCVHPW